jgi:hypothetical protein
MSSGINSTNEWAYDSISSSISSYDDRDFILSSDVEGLHIGDWFVGEAQYNGETKKIWFGSVESLSPTKVLYYQVAEYDPSWTSPFYAFNNNLLTGNFWKAYRANYRTTTARHSNNSMSITCSPAKNLQIKITFSIGNPFDIYDDATGSVTGTFIFTVDGNSNTFLLTRNAGDSPSSQTETYTIYVDGTITVNINTNFTGSFRRRASYGGSCYVRVDIKEII